MQAKSRTSAEFTRRDAQLEDFVRRVQLLAGQFEGLEGPSLCKHCRGLLKAIPGSHFPPNTAITCALLLDVITRIAISRYSPPNIGLVLSAARFCGKIDLHGISAVLAGCSTEPTTRTAEPENLSRDPRVRGTLGLISASYGQASLTLNSVADHVHLSPWHLARLLVEHTGTSFKTHLTETRLRHAATLLEQTFFSIKEIAHACGYSQVETFDRAFKKRFGFQPTRWRALRMSSIQQETSDNSKK